MKTKQEQIQDYVELSTHLIAIMECDMLTKQEYIDDSGLDEQTVNTLIAVSNALENGLINNCFEALRRDMIRLVLSVAKDSGK